MSLPTINIEAITKQKNRLNILIEIKEHTIVVRTDVSCHILSENRTNMLGNDTIEQVFAIKADGDNLIETKK